MAVPKLRFKDGQGHEFPAWVSSTLGDLCILQNGYAFKSEKFREDGIPVIRISNIQNNHVIKNDIIFYPSIAIDDKFIIQQGDILLAMSGATTGKIGRYDDTSIAYLNQRVGKFIETNNLNTEFLFQWLNTSIYTKQLKIRLIAGAQPNVSAKEIAEMQIDIPSLPEQCKIADFLSCYDALIDNQSKRVEALRKRKLGLLQKIFSQEIRFKDDQGNEFPEWKAHEIKELRDLTDSHSFVGGPFGSNLKQSDYTSDGVQVIQLQNIGDGVFIDENKIYTSVPKADELHSCNIYPGDIILAKMAEPLARACIIPNKASRYLMASDGIRLAVNKEQYDSHFVMYAINSPVNRNIIVKHGTGTTRLRISLVTLGNIKIKIPCLKEQQKIADFLGAVDEQIEIAEKKLEIMRNIKKGLLQQLFV